MEHCVKFSLSSNVHFNNQIFKAYTDTDMMRTDKAMVYTHIVLLSLLEYFMFRRVKHTKSSVTVEPECKHPIIHLVI